MKQQEFIKWVNENGFSSIVNLISKDSKGDFLDITANRAYELYQAHPEQAQKLLNEIIQLHGQLTFSVNKNNNPSEISNISITNKALISMLENIAETHFFFFKFKHGQVMIGKSFYYTASDDEEFYAINGQFNLNEISDIFHITPKSSRSCSEFELDRNILKQKIDNQCPVELEELVRNHVVSVQLVNGLNAWVASFDDYVVTRKGEPRLFLQFSNTAEFASVSQIKSINCAIKFR